MPLCLIADGCLNCDMLIMGPCIKSIKHVQSALCENFDMKDPGDAKKILEINIHVNEKSFTLVLH